MNRDHLLSFSIVSLLLASMILTATGGPIAHKGYVHPRQGTIVSVYPQNIDANIGENFNVSVIVENVDNLAGLELLLTWDPTLLNYVDHTATVPVGDYPAPNPPSPYGGIIHPPILQLIDEVNATAGTYWEAFVTLGGPTFNGSGTASVMTFYATREGATSLNLTVSNLAGPGSPGTPIPHEKAHGLFRTPGRPFAHFTAPLTAEVNATIVFNASQSYHPDSPTHLIANYTWDFDDGSPVTVTDQPVISHSFAMSGTFDVELIVTDDIGLTDDERGEIIVPSHDIMVESVEAGAPYMFLPGQIADCTVTIRNLGEVTENNVEVGVYYNTTTVDPSDIYSAQWELISTYNISILGSGSFRRNDAFWNTTGASLADYYFMANTTVPLDENRTNNAMLSDRTISLVATFAPVAIFSYSPVLPIIGETLTFDASPSYVLQGEIASFFWDFGDGTQKNVTGPVTTHVFNTPGSFNVTLIVSKMGDNETGSMTLWVNVATYQQLDISLDVGTIHFAGETASFTVLILRSGIRVNVLLNEISATLYFNNQTTGLVDPGLSLEQLDMGLFRVTYDIPLDAAEGSYTLLVEVNHDTGGSFALQGASLKTFLISATLNGWDAQLTSIEGNIATIIIPGITEIKADLSEINASIIDIQGMIATINTTIGSLETELNNLETTLSDLIINSEGEILAEIETALGTVTTSLDDLQGSVSSMSSILTIGLAIASILSAIAAIGAIITLLAIRRAST